MERIPKPQEIYRHFKGNLYQIVTIAEHSETGEQLVIYQALYGTFKTYARPLSMFMERVDRNKYPDAAQEYRFEPAVGFGRQSCEEKTEKTEISTVEVHNNEVKATEVPEQKGGEEELPLDPMVLEFLDAGTYEERLNILAGLHHRITDDMINVMAMATDIEIKPGDVEERYTELRACLLKLEKFECNRLR